MKITVHQQRRGIERQFERLANGRRRPLALEIYRWRKREASRSSMATSTEEDQGTAAYRRGGGKRRAHGEVGNKFKEGGTCKGEDVDITALDEPSTAAANESVSKRILNERLVHARTSEMP